MLDELLFAYAFNLRNAHHLVRDLTAEQAVAQPAGLVNHVCWSIGHLALASNVVLVECGQEMGFPEAWMQRYLPGAAITGVAEDYPPLGELMSQLESAHERLASFMSTATPALLAEAPKMEMVQRRFSSVGQFAVYAMTAHEGMHLGQICDLRRALGLENTDL